MLDVNTNAKDDPFKHETIGVGGGSSIYNSIARIVCRIANAKAARIGALTRDRNDKVTGVRVLGAHGISSHDLGPQWDISFLLGGDEQYIYVSNVQKDARFRHHPVRTSWPGLQKLIYIPIRGAGNRIGSIVIYDPDPQWHLLETSISVFMDASRICSEATRLCSLLAEPLSVGPFHLAEGPASASPPVVLEPTSRFLLSTLGKSAAWRQRKRQSFITLRKWRASIKSHQIAALDALKASPPSEFLDAVAEDFSQAVRAMFGAGYFTTVTNVPCGHSATEHCFSSQLGRAVAAKLGLPHAEVFDRQYRSGRSHPRNNATLAQFKMSNPVAGTVLVVDDVATSGRHLELASMSLQATAAHVVPMAWIGS